MRRLLPLHHHLYPRTAVVAVTALATVMAAVVPPAHAAPPPAKRAPVVAGDEHPTHDKDNRTGTAAPNSRQRSLGSGSVRWNAFGTPGSIGPAKALATGLAADPEQAARQYLVRNRDLFGIDEAAVARMDRVLVRSIGSGSVVMLRQRFGDLPAGHDGLVSILVAGGNVVRVTSSLTRDTAAPAPATLSATQAFESALRDLGLRADQIRGLSVRQVAVPTPTQGTRAAFAVTFNGIDEGELLSVTTYVDARTGAVLVREDLVDFDSDNPVWAVFPAAPPSSVPAGGDPRVRWCYEPMPGCVRTVRDAASGKPWDVNLTTGAPTLTTSGNSASSVVLWDPNVAGVPATPSPDRRYIYPWTDQWRQARCDPAVFTSAQRNDADAAVTNLFAMHNRMHDWSYHLGFTEETWNLQLVNLGPNGLGGDPEIGRAQAGALTGSRNNANQGTGRDGLPPVSNMFLWQPVAGSAYPPCVDGDYDMTVIAHEYGHAITNRMIAGPDTGIGSSQGGAMGESWSDLIAAEYLFENNLRAPGNSPFVIGAYVTGNQVNGIRNYDGSKSPLNYSDVGWDLVGPQVHADGEIWTATNLRLREAFLRRYGAGTPALQERCATGAVAIESCPGNRRWIQLMFDSFLLQATSQFSMVDMRDNMLAADLVRFGGANQELMWQVFAQSGLGRDASSGPGDIDPVPSFASPYGTNATVTLRPLGDSAGAVVRLYIGDYEARAVPVADTDPETDIPDTFEVVANTSMPLVATGPGFGHRKFTTLFLPRSQELRLNLPRNLAATASGAVVSGDGVNLDKIADDTEATDWASLDGVAGKRITFDLAGDRPQLVSTVNVSALLRPAIEGDIDAGLQNRFTALRSFTVLACNATSADCTSDAGYREVYRSSSSAFPGGNFRPFASQLNLRTFQFAPTSATHLRLVVTASQCTGGPAYAGEQDNDPRAATDCRTASPFAQQVRIAEFEAFSR